jgi:hypothetical protein
MSKFLFGVAVGYILSDMIDDLLGKKTAEDVKLHPTAMTDTPEPMDPTVQP